MVRWILVVVAALAALAAIIAVIYGMGASLPRDHVARVERVIAASPDALAARIRSVETYAQWRKGVAVDLRARTADGVDYVETSDGDAIAYRLQEPAPGRQFTTTITDDTLPFGGRWTIDLLPEGAGTRVRIEEAGEIRDPLYRFFARFVFGYTSSMETYLGALEMAGA